MWIFETTFSPRFDKLLPVLLDLISLPDITHLSPALAQLPVAANSDRLWKQFNFQLLNLSKSLSPMVGVFFSNFWELCFNFRTLGKISPGC
jgi:hypothetical protein